MSLMDGKLLCVAETNYHFSGNEKKSKLTGDKGKVDGRYKQSGGQRKKSQCHARKRNRTGGRERDDKKEQMENWVSREIVMRGRGQLNLQTAKRLPRLTNRDV